MFLYSLRWPKCIPILSEQAALLEYEKPADRVDPGVMARVLIVLLALWSGAVCAQDTLPAPRFHMRPEMGILVGYSKEIDPEHHAPIHFAEFGLVRGAGGGRHMDSWSYHASTLFGLSGSTPILAPRIGAQFAMMISFGVELAYFTDLETGSLVLVPSIGYIGYPLNIALKPNVYLLNTDFKPAGGGCLSVTYRLVRFRSDGQERRRF